jgi:UrcA family protein
MTRIHAGLMGIAAVVALTAGAAKAQTYANGGYDNDGAYAAPAYGTDSAYTGYNPDGAPTAGEITVYAPRVRHYSSRIGAPEEIVRESRIVQADDLDLTTGWGAHELRMRIEHAARETCGDLGDRYMAVDSGRDCVRVAVRNAMYEVEDRLGFAPPSWPDLG